jgi:hypothetical protein
MVVVSTVPIPYRFIALMQKCNSLFAYPLERLAGEIRATGFQCSCCGTCCSRSVNGHIFLLDRELADVKKIDSDAFEPAPDPKFCDQNGMLYVSGYAIRMKNASSLNANSGEMVGASTSVKWRKIIPF